MLSCCWWKMYGVKSKIGPLCICCLVVWLVLVYSDISGQLEKSTLPHPLPPPKVGEALLFFISQTASRRFLSLSLMKSTSTSPTIGGGRGGEGCSFSAVSKFCRRPKPTIPLHSKFINHQLCFWHYTFSTNSSSTITYCQ